jgi:hypothetical protein
MLQKLTNFILISIMIPSILFAQNNPVSTDEVEKIVIKTYINGNQINIYPEWDQANIGCTKGSSCNYLLGIFKLEMINLFTLENKVIYGNDCRKIKNDSNQYSCYIDINHTLEISFHWTSKFNKSIPEEKNYRGAGNDLGGGRCGQTGLVFIGGNLSLKMNASHVQSQHAEYFYFPQYLIPGNDN